MQIDPREESPTPSLSVAAAEGGQDDDEKEEDLRDRAKAEEIAKQRSIAKGGIDESGVEGGEDNTAPPKSP